MNTKLIIAIVLFLAGLCFIMKYRTKDVVEGFGDFSNCPNLLVKKDSDYYLYNTTKAEVPGVNPIKFSNLEDYTEFMQWLRGEGIRCPVLYLQQTYDTQGERTYRMLPDPKEQHPGLPPTIPHVTKLYDAGHNKGSYPGFDPENQYVGDYTPLDEMYHSKKAISDNPMDTNWGGPAWSRESVREGDYAEDTVLTKKE